MWWHPVKATATRVALNSSNCYTIAVGATRTACDKTRALPPWPHDPEPQPEPAQQPLCEQQQEEETSARGAEAITCVLWSTSPELARLTKVSEAATALSAVVSRPCPGCASAGKANSEHSTAAISNHKTAPMTRVHTPECPQMSSTLSCAGRATRTIEMLLDRSSTAWQP